VGGSDTASLNSFINGRFFVPHPLCRGGGSGRLVDMESEKSAGKPRKRATSSKSQDDSTTPTKKANTRVRLQRALAAAGYGSRRHCEELIVEGRILVDGKIVTELGVSVEPSVQKIFVDGTPLKPRRLVYYALNKPVGVVTTNVDPEGRPRVVDLVPPDERVFPVGRLDRSSEGLILLTNDGDLAQRLAHPKYEICKVYRVTVAGKIEAETLRQMERGIHIAEGLVKVEGARLLKTRGRATELEITLKEGKNREIRRILARLGHKVQELKRIAIGPLRLGEMPTGAYRKLGIEELKKLKAAVEPAATRRRVEDAGDDMDDDDRTGDRKRTASRTSKKSARPFSDAPRKKFSQKGASKDSDGERGAIGSRPTGRPSASRPSGGRPTGDKSPGSRRPLPKRKEASEVYPERISTGSIIGADPPAIDTEKLARRGLGAKKGIGKGTSNRDRSHVVVERPKGTKKRASESGSAREGRAVPSGKRGFGKTSTTGGRERVAGKGKPPGEIKARGKGNVRGKGNAPGKGTKRSGGQRKGD